MALAIPSTRKDLSNDTELMPGLKKGWVSQHIEYGRKASLMMLVKGSLFPNHPRSFTDWKSWRISLGQYQSSVATLAKTESSGPD